MPRAFVWFNISSRPFWDIAEEGPHDRFGREATATGRSVWLALFPGLRGIVISSSMEVGSPIWLPRSFSSLASLRLGTI